MKADQVKRSDGSAETVEDEMKPITPSEVTNLKAKMIPPEVIEVFNELIMEQYDQGGKAVVLQKEVVQRILDKKRAMLPPSAGNQESIARFREVLFEKGWLNIEGIYRASGWKVTYDKPGYNETYEASWTFERRSV